jgi:hypothetical protein
VRTGLSVVGVAGVAALVAAAFATVIRVTVGATSRLAALDTHLSGCACPRRLKGTRAMFGRVVRLNVARVAR